MLSIISAKNRTFAHIQPITFPFLIPSSACFLYSVPRCPAHIRDHDADARCGSLYRIEAAWSYLRENDTGVRQNHQPEKRRSSQFGQRAIRLM